MKCRYKESCGHEFCPEDECPEYDAAVETNADRIRAMSDEELAEWIRDMPIEPCCYCDPQRAFGALCGVDSACRDGILAWLHKPVQED